MSERNDLHQAGPTLTSEWIKLLSECSFQYQNQNYYESWILLLDLQSCIPVEVYKKTKIEYDKIQEHLNKILKQKFYSKLQAKNAIRPQTASYLREVILPLKRTIHTSLEENGWITREQNTGRPAYSAVGHLGNTPR
jgi:hypothetical protein